MSDENEVVLPQGQEDGLQLNSDPIILYYAGEGFYTSEFIETAFVNGYTMEDLTVISQEDYNAWFNPPAGKINIWKDGKPVLVDLPPPDYLAINTIEADNRKNAAMQSVAIIQTKLAMGRTLTAAEKAKMNAVLDYCDAIDALDLSVPNPDWPTQP